MIPDDTAILHSGSYEFRSNVALLVTRAVDANDTAQRTWLSTHLTAVKAAKGTGSTVETSDFTQDTLGHAGRHLKWLSSDILYRATQEADIATDLDNIIDAALLLL